MAGVSQRDDADVEDSRALPRPCEGPLEDGAVVGAGDKHDLGVRLDPRGQQAIQRIEPMLGMLADEGAAHVGIRRVQRHAQRGDALLDDAALIVRLEIGERHERPRQKAQAEIVIAQRERGPHARGQLAHETERAGVAALAHAVEDDAVEAEPPCLALLAHELDLTRFAVEVDVAHRDGVVGRQPAPIDEVAQGASVDRRDAAAGLEPRIVGGAQRLDGDDQRPDAAGGAITMRRAALPGSGSRCDDVLRRVRCHRCGLRYSRGD